MPESPTSGRSLADKPGPHVLVQALTHGNEVCGAIALDWLLREAVRPTRGTLSIAFANVAAYETFDRADPFASRCVDEDFNRLWTADVLDGPRQIADLDRARELRPLYDRVDYLLDLHSMTDPCPPLAMAGRQRKGVELAQALGLPQHIVVDGGHAAGQAAARLRVLRRRRRPPQRAADRMRPALGALVGRRREADHAALPAAFGAPTSGSCRPASRPSSRPDDHLSWCGTMPSPSSAAPRSCGTSTSCSSRCMAAAARTARCRRCWTGGHSLHGQRPHGQRLRDGQGRRPNDCFARPVSRRQTGSWTPSTPATRSPRLDYP